MRLHFNENQSCGKGAVMLVAGQPRTWEGTARLETLDEKFNPKWWRAQDLDSVMGVSMMVYEEGTPPSLSHLHLSPLDGVMCIYNRGRMRIVTRACTRDEKILLGTDRVPVVNDSAGRMIHFHKRHVYERIMWR